MKRSSSASGNMPASFSLRASSDNRSAVTILYSPYNIKLNIEYERKLIVD
jgi:hypothetical protein